MTSGLQALVRSAGDAPLDFPTSIYAGDMMITGRPAPSSWFHKATRDAYLRQVWDSLAKVRDESQRTAKYQEVAQTPLVWLDAAASAEEDENSSDELTIVDVYVFPSISTGGTQSGGHWLPVMRVPFSSIASWWIVEGRNIPGKSGYSGGFGLGFAIGV